MNWIAIFGKQNLHNDMLAYVLARETGATASIEESVPLFESRLTSTEGNKLLCLVDARTASLERIIAASRIWTRTVRQESVVALFNLEKGGGIEQSAVRQGVRGFFYVRDGLDLLVKGVQKLFAGEIWAPREMLFSLAQTPPESEISSHNDRELTKREMQVLAHVCTGLSNEEIAETLNVSPHTIKTHLYRVFKKIDVTNRFQASLWAAKHL